MQILVDDHFHHGVRFRIFRVTASVGEWVPASGTQTYGIGGGASFLIAIAPSIAGITSRASPCERDGMRAILATPGFRGSLGH